MSLPFVERSESRRLRTSLASVTPGATARRTYAAMLGEQIEPVMEEWGFLPVRDEADARGIARFTYPSDVWHLGLALVPMAWSTAATLRFDVRVLAVPREAWRQWRAAEPALAHEPDPAVYCAHDVAAVGGVEARLGELDGRGPDHRWSVRAEEDPTATAAAVLTAIRRRALPAFAGRAEAPPLAG